MLNNATISAIKDFPSLVEFLIDELDWPIDIDRFDDLDALAYEFTPEELGLKDDLAAKIKVIKQLRPLSGDQPWDVFWIDFEPRRLPITVLRRILSRFVTKKRARPSDIFSRPMDDLLFITAQGEDQHRGITFAHFRKGIQHK